MFNIETVWESIKRRWIFIALITILCLAGGVYSSYMSRGEEVVNAAYTAEAMIYVSSYDSNEAGERYNYVVNDDHVISDARRIVVSNEVAGEVRRQMGTDITVTSPWWMDLRNDARYYMHHIFIACSASSPEKALAACTMATELTVERIGLIPDIATVFVESEPDLTSMSDRAMDWGSDPFPDLETQITTASTVSNSISVKTLVVFGAIGLILSILLFAAYDIFTRKVRSGRDVERLLEVPVLAELRSTDSFSSIADDIQVLLDRHGFESAIAVGAVPDDQAERVAGLLSDAGATISGSCAISDAKGVSSALRSADSAVLVLTNAKASGKALDELKQKLCIAETPVLGTVFLKK